MRDDSIIETTFVKFCKRTLSVHRKTTNIAVLSKLGVYSLKIDKLNMLMYNIVTNNIVTCYEQHP